MKGNTSKKKMIVALSIAAVVVVAAIVSVVAVFAAPQQNVTSGVTVTYRVNDVYASVSARYAEAAITLGDNGAVTVGKLQTINNLGAMSYKADGTSTGAITAATVTLDSNEKRAVIFEYNFTNDGENTFEITKTEDPTKNNMKVLYSVTTGVAATDTWATLTWTETLSDDIIAAAADAAGNTDEVHIYVMAYVDNLAKAADYTGNINWQLDSIAQA